MARTAVVFFCMPEEGHLQRMLPVIRGLHARGMTVHVFTHGRFRGAVEGAGGALIDMFARHPLSVADDVSLPVPCRFVSYAGHFGSEIIAEVARLRPALVVYDTFAVVGRVVARALDLPAVNICAGHNVDPGRFLDILATDPRVRVGPACHAAVERLRTEFGISDASPFSYVAGLSSRLNVYCEPPAFLTAEERRAFEPVVFFGSLPSPEHLGDRCAAQGPTAFGNGEAAFRLYVSFGTIIWRYYATQALRALDVIADAVAARAGMRAVISVGGADLASDTLQALRRRNVAVERRVNQWAVLEGAGAFVTHQGLNSTHEAIYHGVPMISYPFFWDQPGLAEKCQAFGIAFPLAGSLRGPISVQNVHAALDLIESERGSVRERLEEARQRELEVMAERPAVIERIAALV